jgi:endonuclease/exonuclease/phosphatase (EEP) superfamily protein YafD
MKKKKQEFISELHDLFLHWDGPALIGGDFNLIRSSLDKNTNNIDYRWVDKFNTPG